MVLTKTVILKQAVDEGLPGPEHFETQESEVPDLDIEGSIQLRITAMSADPYLRMRIKSSSSFGNVEPGHCMAGFVVGKVIASRGNPDWAEGDLFGGNLPFSTVQNLSPEDLKVTLLWKLTDILSEEELTLGLGLLGMPGSTAYGGLIDVLAVKEGETIFVSAASGAVGSLVGMIAKNVYNCTVIGSCGGPEKAALIKEKFGYDHAIDYKTLKGKDDLVAALTEVAPEGIDM
jgi:NADPH-dependent curcumin reductase CurA